MEPRCLLCSQQRTLHHPSAMSAKCQQRKSRSRPTRSNHWCRETARRVTLEVLLCGGGRYASESEPANDRYHGLPIQKSRYGLPIQKYENWVRARAFGPLLPVRLCHVPDEPKLTRGNDKSQEKAGSGGRPSSPPRPPHRNDQDR